MSKHLLSFLLSELETIRVICRHDSCRGIIELSIEDLARRQPTKCPFCNGDWDYRGDRGPLAKYADAIADLKRCEKRMAVEFVLPVAE
jgi:hypothetical protein